MKGGGVGNFCRSTGEVGGGVTNFPSSCISFFGRGGGAPNLPLLLQFQIIFFTTKKQLLLDFRLFSFKLNN